MKIERLMEQIETDQGFERFLKVILIGLVIFIILLFNNVFATTTEENLSATSTENGKTTEEKSFGFEEESFGTEEESFEMGILSNGGCVSIFKDDFNSYNDGNLHGQGSWDGDTSHKIQGTTTYEGAKAVSNTDSSGAWKWIKKTGTLRAAGNQGFYVKRTSTNGYVNLQFYEGATARAALNFGYNNNTINLYKTGWALQQIGTLNLNIWYWLEMEWTGTGASSQIRARIDDGAWSDWYESPSGWTSGLDVIQLGVSHSSAQTTNFDYLDCEEYVEPIPPDYVSLTNLTILYFIAFMIMIMAITLFTKRKNVV